MTNEYNFFNRFNLKSEKEVDELVNNLTKEQSLFFLIESVKHSYEKGLFNLHESELISKSIRMLYTPSKIKNDE
jgi:hypothetical protein